MNLKKNKINESLKPNWIIEFIIAIKFQLERWLSSHSKGTTLAFMLRWLFFESAGSYFRQKVNSVENWKKWWEKKLNEAWFEIFCCCYDGHTFGGHRKWKWRQFFMKIYFYYVAHLGQNKSFLVFAKKNCKEFVSTKFWNTKLRCLKNFGTALVDHLFVELRIYVWVADVTPNKDI